MYPGRREVLSLLVLWALAAALSMALGQPRASSFGVSVTVINPKDPVPADGPQRTLADLEAGKRLLIPNNQVFQRSDWRCTDVCIDKDGVVVGDVSPEMQKWLQRNSSVR